MKLLFRQITGMVDQDMVQIFLLQGFALSLYVIRVWASHSLHYGFLVWNLFLAGIPLVLSTVIPKIPDGLFLRYTKILMWLLWFVFLPNSFYLITDLIHLHDPWSSFKYFDLFLIFVFAIAGIVMGLYSLFQFRRMLQKYLSGLQLNLLLAVICLSSGFGVYIGRVIRFNSWDIISRPATVVTRMFESISYSTTWWFTLGFGMLIWILYRLLWANKDEDK